MDDERIQWFGETKCDFCGNEIKNFLYDGMTHEGGMMWSTMCEHCFEEHGKGVGWGTGQKYQQTPEGEFYLIEGGEPEQKDSEDSDDSW